jgi:hypothetical protein
MKYLLLLLIIVPLIGNGQNTQVGPLFDTTTITITSCCTKFGFGLDTCGTHSVCIGEYAGMNLTTQNHVIIIGDYSFRDTSTYQSRTLNYKDDYWYFKTERGKEMKKYLSTSPKGQELSLGQMHDIIGKILTLWMPDIQQIYSTRNQRN